MPRVSQRPVNDKILTIDWICDELAKRLKPKRKKAVPKVRRKHLSTVQKEQIILYRFGELGTTDNIFCPLKWIAKKMNLFYQTVVRIVRQYKLDNC